MESPRWFSIDYALREINREKQLVTLDDILLFGVQGFLKIHMMIGTNGDLMTYRLIGNSYQTSDIKYNQCWSTLPIAEMDTLQELRLNTSTTIKSILVSGNWRDPEVKSILFKDPKEMSRQQLTLWHEEYEKLRDFFFPNTPVVEKPLHANERNTLLDIIRALAGLNGIKPNSGAYRKEAESLLTKISSKGIEAPCNEKTLAKHLLESFKER